MRLGDCVDGDRFARSVVGTLHLDPVASVHSGLVLVAELIGHFVAWIVENICASVLYAGICTLAGLFASQSVARFHALFTFHLAMAAHLSASAVHNYTAERLGRTVLVLVLILGWLGVSCLTE